MSDTNPNLQTNESSSFQPYTATDQEALKQIDELLDSIDSYLKEASNLAELGVYSSMYAHEVNNLMTQVGGRAQLALMHMDRPELIVEALKLACRASTQVAQLSEIFLESVRKDSKFKGEYSLREIHRQTLSFVSPQDIERYGFAFDDQGDDVHICIPPILLQQVLLNLYLNAIRAIEEASLNRPGRIQTRVSRVQNQCSPWNTSRVQIVVEDNGPGMTHEQINHVFNPQDPWSSRRGTPTSDRKEEGQKRSSSILLHGKGHGLGLSICKKLLKDAHGTIRAESTPGAGTKMMITLPIASVANESKKSA